MRLTEKQSELAAKVVASLVTSRFPPGHRVTEEQLTSEFGVSRSPVRAIMPFLAAKGFLVQADRGYFVPEKLPEFDPGSPVIPKSADQELLDAIALDRARDRVPEQFSEAEFMRRYNVPRTQLIRVLNRLALDGIVERGVGQGWVFLPTLNNIKNYQDSYRFRIILEPAGLLEPSFVPDEPKLRALRDAHVALSQSPETDQSTFFELNASFHETLASCSNNMFIIEAVHRQSRLRRLNEQLHHDDARAKERIAEHIAIIDAVLSDQREWAASLLKRHLEIASRVTPPFAT